MTSTSKPDHYICETKPTCKCAGIFNPFTPSWDECCCIRNGDICTICLVPMVAIHLDPLKGKTKATRKR
jgi:hypothetical protein